MPRPGDESLLGETILGDRQTAGSGTTGTRAARNVGGLRRHVLELVGDDVDVVGEAVERLGVGIVGARSTRCTTSKAGESGLGREDVAVEAEPGRGERQHAAELAAAQNADRGARLERRAG